MFSPALRRMFLLSVLCNLAVADTLSARTWTARNSKHQTEAVLLQVAADLSSVVLGLPSGRAKRIELAALSDLDREYVKQWEADQDRGQKLLELGREKLSSSDSDALEQWNKGVRLGHPRCSFQFGMVSAKRREYQNAENGFRECVRFHTPRAPFTQPNKYTLLASLNNLGLVQMRQRKFTAAVASFRKASQTFEKDRPAELIHNLHLVLHTSSRVPRVHNSAQTLVSAVKQDVTARTFDEKFGWIYMWEEPKQSSPLNHAVMPEQSPARRLPLTPSSIRNFDVLTSSTGIVLTSRLVMAVRSVIQDKDGVDYPIVTVCVGPTAGKLPPQQGIKATVMAKCDTANLAVIELESDVETNGIQWVVEDIQRGAAARTLGFARNAAGEFSNTALRGAIAKLPVKANDGMLLVKPVPDSSSRGAPVLDERGRCFGVFAAAIKDQSNFAGLVQGQYYGGIVPAEQTIAFLRNVVPDFQLDLASPDSSESVSLDQATQAAHRATALVHAGKAGQPTQLATDVRVSRSAPIGASGVWNGDFDRTCHICNGQKWQRCTNGNCSGGKERATTIVKIPKVVGNRLMQVPVTKTFTKTCATCGGDDKIRCLRCRGSGNDPLFAGR